MQATNHRQPAQPHDLRGEQLQISDHVELRFLERVDATEPFPCTRIKREFREAVPVKINDEDITDPTRRHPESGVVYIFDPTDATIITSFVPREEQLAGYSSPPKGVVE